MLAGQNSLKVGYHLFMDFSKLDKEPDTFKNKLAALMKSDDPEALYIFLSSPKTHAYFLYRFETQPNGNEKQYYGRLIEKLVFPALERFQARSSALGTKLNIQLEDKTGIFKHRKRVSASPKKT